MEDIIIDIKADFSDSPGARYRKDGPHSGEEFFEVLAITNSFYCN